MPKKDQLLKLKTKKEKEVASKVITELIVLVKVFDSFPKSQEIETKKWGEGVIWGMKYLIAKIAEYLNDPEQEKFFKKLIDWEKAEKEMLERKR
jgi:hypothetical protein